MRDILKQRSSLEPQNAQRVYEVRCEACDVSFPPDAKRCIHCGGHLGARAIFAPETTVEMGPGSSPSDRMGGSAWTVSTTEGVGESQSGTEPGTRRPAPANSEETETPRKSIFRVFGNLAWIMLFVAISIYRNCEG